MRVVLLGPPGAGKGTQARQMAARYGVPQISTGDILRQAAARGTPLGRRAKTFMDRGDLVPDDLVGEIVEERLLDDDCKTGFILDGFPRTVAQAEALERFLERKDERLDAVISIEVAREDVVKRLGGRRVCPECGAMYHEVFDPPAREGRCDDCHGELRQRSDDKEDTVSARLDVYWRSTAVLLGYYRDRGLLVAVDGSGCPQEVFGRVVAGLRGEGGCPAG